MNFKLLSLATLILINFSCKKENNNTNNNITSPFEIKYEIICTSKVKASLYNLVVSYINSTGQIQTESLSDISSGSPWVKNVNVTSSSRPLELNLLLSSSYPSYYLILQNSGSIVQNLYINGVIVASSTNQSESQPTGVNNTYRISLQPLSFIVN